MNERKKSIGEEKIEIFEMIHKKNRNENRNKFFHTNGEESKS
jgi:hypothetical protein